MKKGDEEKIENVIYGDVLLVINFSMDFLALFITAKLMHLKISRSKINLAAILGALWSLATVLFSLTGVCLTLLSIFFSFIMIFVAFGKTKLFAYLKNTAVFYAVNFGLGGGITALANLFNMWAHSRKVYINGTYDTIYGSLPFGLLVFLSLFCSLFSYLFGKLVKKRKTESTAEIEISLCGKKATLSALVDSGNLVREPLSDRPVILCTYENVRKLLPPDVLPFFLGKELPKAYPGIKLRAIPASSFSGNRVLFAVIPDELKVNGISSDALIAVDTVTPDYGGKQALCPSVLCT